MKKLISGVMAMIVMSANAAPSPESDKLAQFNKRIDAVEISDESAPLIGVTPTGSTPTSVSKPYIDAVLRAGGVPVVIAANPSAEYLAQVVTQLDGVLLTGGEDIDPEYFGEKAIEQLGAVDDVRDEVELAVLRLAANRNIPVFGICRGCQVINVGFGGTLYQDFPSQRGQQV
ncbi:MAG: gamma-glutamyl-gamma-aminobutyrate hydrolase family protein, partial [bacterium]|nr:gamma-glutamyl-gamma-aminobutyrate hydrolase family protein [bacterium]